VCAFFFSTALFAEEKRLSPHQLRIFVQRNNWRCLRGLSKRRGNTCSILCFYPPNHSGTYHIPCTTRVSFLPARKPSRLRAVQEAGQWLINHMLLSPFFARIVSPRPKPSRLILESYPRSGAMVVQSYALIHLFARIVSPCPKPSRLILESYPRGDCSILCFYPPFFVLGRITTFLVPLEPHYLPSETISMDS
jgi:hypothetical protein